MLPHACTRTSTRRYIEGFLKVTLVTLGIYVAIWLRAFLFPPLHQVAPFDYLNETESIVLTIFAILPIPLVIAGTANVIRSCVVHPPPPPRPTVCVCVCVCVCVGVCVCVCE
jgi:hypothetical protein